MAALFTALAACAGSDSEASDADASRDADAGIEAAVEQLDVEQLQISTALWGVAIAGERVWVSDPTAATVVELDAQGTPVQTVPTGAADPRDAGLAVDGVGHLWVANLGGTVVAVDSATGAVGDRIEVGPGEPAAVAIAAGKVWVPRHGPGGGLAVLSADGADPRTDVPVPFDGFAVAAAAGSGVWVTGLDAGLVRVGAEGDVELELDLPGAPRGVVVVGRDAWVSLAERGEVVRIEGRTGEVVARMEVGGTPWPIASGGGALWVATLEGELLRIDPETATITGDADVAPQPRGVAVGAGAVWVTSQTGALSRVALD
jgi:DNA-binding beta-propeller fold protein YncE